MFSFKKAMIATFSVFITETSVNAPSAFINESVEQGVT